MDTVGQKIKKQRESRNLSLAMAAKATKIRAERLAEMEEDNFSKINGLRYQREFVRTYAKYLKMDANELVLEFNEQFGYEAEDYGTINLNSPVRPVVAVTREVRLKPVAILYIVVGLVILLVLLPILINLWRVGVFKIPTKVTPEVVVSGGSIPHPAVRAPLGQPGVPVAVTSNAQGAVIALPTNVVAQVPVVPVKNKLAIRASDDCWIRVTLDGQTDENDGGFILDSDTQKEFEAEKFTVEVFNPSLVTILYNGQEVANSNQGTEPKTINLP
ncbi:MAG: helix-turn-helix domain-containing protein [Verrucomicrobiota bacterium]|nr:helix-turn-helix domain-containing protein [Verrucomicrobiota bacterium]